jgi:hypothetical protein
MYQKKVIDEKDAFLEETLENKPKIVIESLYNVETC